VVDVTDVELGVDRELANVPVLRAVFPPDLAHVASSPAILGLQVKGGARKLICPLASYPDLQSMLESGGGGRRVRLRVGSSVVAEAALRYIPAGGTAEECQALFQSALSPALRAMLLPFQKEGVLFCLRHGGRVLLADEMGLGKTVQAICAALCYCNEWPLLILAPKALCGNWSKELQRWLQCNKREQAVPHSGVGSGQVSPPARASTGSEAPLEHFSVGGAGSIRTVNRKRKAAAALSDVDTSDEEWGQAGEAESHHNDDGGEGEAASDAFCP